MNAARFIDGSHENLESRAVADFSQRHRVSVVPVDRNEPDEEFFSVTKDLFALVERTSCDYRNLVDRHSECTARGGLQYLNSGESAQAYFDIHNEVRATIDWMGASDRHADYDMWLHEMNRRDQEMIANIIQFAAESELARGVLLVGAAHRKSIIDKVLSELGTGSSTVEWQLKLPSALFE